jgi:hypothetical protein
MHENECVTEGVGKGKSASDRQRSPKRRWVTPGLRKLKVDQTESGGGVKVDGNFVS